MFFKKLLITLILCRFGRARLPVTKKKTQWGQIAADACARELESYNYDIETKGRHATLCTYQPAFKSWLHCSKSVLEDRGIGISNLEGCFLKINELCSEFREDGASSFDDYIKILDDSEESVVSLEDANVPISKPVAANRASLNEWVWAIYGPLDNLDKGNVYGAVICFFWLGVLVVSSVYNLLMISRVEKLRRLVIKNKFTAWIRGRIVIPALSNRHATAAGEYCFISLIPSRLETLTMAVYVALHLTLLLKVNIDHGQLLSNYKNQVVIFLSDRAGILAFAHFPLIIMFAGRNHLLQSLTGIKYSSFVVFHKWLGRVMLADAILHAVGYTYHSFLSHYWVHVKHNPVWHYGRVAVVTAGGVIFFSILFFRYHCYELFLVVHILVAAAFFYACLKHCMNLGWTEWVVAALIFWCLDRLVRLLKIIKFGFPIARLELYGENIIKVKIPKSGKRWKAKPGQYIHLQFLKPAFFWQSHPFSVMDSATGEDELAVVVTVKKGVTKRLKSSLICGRSAEMRVAVEGPYGHSLSSKGFEGVLYLAAGAGVPGPLSMALEAAKVEKDQGKLLTFVWTFRDISLLEVFEKEIKVLQHSCVDLQLYFTGKESSDRPAVEQEQKALNNGGKAEETGRFKTENFFPVMQHGRPKLEELLGNAVEWSDSLLVVTCGSPSFVDKSRGMVAQKVIQNPEKCIQYVEDFQNW